MAYEWYKYSDQTPTHPGYYLTLYYNNDHQAHLTKCIYWDGHWCAWRPGIKEDPLVKGFVQDTLNPHYVPCAMNADQHVTHVDLDLFPFLKEPTHGT